MGKKRKSLFGAEMHFIYRNREWALYCGRSIRYRGSRCETKKLRNGHNDLVCPFPYKTRPFINHRLCSMIQADMPCIWKQAESKEWLDGQPMTTRVIQSTPPKLSLVPTNLHLDPGSRSVVSGLEILLPFTRRAQTSVRQCCLPPVAIIACVGIRGGRLVNLSRPLVYMG